MLPQVSTNDVRSNGVMRPTSVELLRCQHHDPRRSLFHGNGRRKARETGIRFVPNGVKSIRNFDVPEHLAVKLEDEGLFVRHLLGISLLKNEPRSSVAIRKRGCLQPYFRASLFCLVSCFSFGSHQIEIWNL